MVCLEGCYTVLKLDLALATGFNSQCKIWFDDWSFSCPRVDRGPIPIDQQEIWDSRVCQYIQNGKISFLSALHQYALELGIFLRMSILSQSKQLIFKFGRGAVLPVDSKGGI